MHATSFVLVVKSMLVTSLDHRMTNGILRKSPLSFRLFWLRKLVSRKHNILGITKRKEMVQCVTNLSH